MAMLKTKSIGNKQFESECLRCGEIMIWEKGDDVFVEVTDDGTSGMLCSKCYDGPRASPEQKAELLKKKPDSQ